MKRLFKWLFLGLLIAVAIVAGLLLSKDAILKAAGLKLAVERA